MMKYLSWLVLFVLTGCSSVFDVMDDSGGEKPTPQRIRMYEGKPRAALDVAVISQTSDGCFFNKSNADLDVLDVMYGVILIHNTDEYYNSIDIYDFLPGYYPFHLIWNERVTKFGTDNLPNPDFMPYDETISEQATEISMPLNLKAGYSYRFLLETVEGKEACNLCVEETPRDNYNQPMKNLSKKTQCKVLQ